jgi:hypothetical protein
LDNDVVEITGGNEIIFTGKGDDIVDALTGTGGNRIYGGTDNDELLAGQNDRLFGGEGDKIFWMRVLVLAEIVSMAVLVRMISLRVAMTG